ncbi:MAG: 3-hydroxybutyryl-CoA dehydrogenase [Elusimicrobiota bacterium]
MDIQKVAVIGGGQMGNGIAHVFALAGIEAVIIDLNKDLLDKALGAIKKNMERQVKKEVIQAADMEAALGRITTSDQLADAASAQLVVEAVTENFEVKKKIFAELDSVCPAETILASNTSSLPITRLAAVTKRAPRVIGMHFMNPVPMMKLVEIIRGVDTSDATYELIHALCGKLGKTPACSQDYPGFISNRVLMPMINEACFALMEGVAKAEDIDTVMKLGMNHPMGPLMLADFIGLDTCLAILEVLHDGLGDPKYRPCPLLRKKVEAGHLGRKSGRGFHDWSKKK